MRDEKRIDEICDALKEEWHKVPDWRFLQLICNLTRYIGFGDGFYVDDDEFLRSLREFFKNQKL